MTYREDTRNVVIDALKKDGLDTHPDIVADTLINNLLDLDTVVCSLPRPMMALLRCLHDTGLWGCTLEEVLEQLASTQLRCMAEDTVKGNEWFPGGISNIIDAYGDKEEKNDGSQD